MKNTFLSPKEYQSIGHELIDQLSQFLASIENLPLTNAETPDQLQEVLGKISLAENGVEAKSLIKDITQTLIEHSLFNGHPGFMGYITSSALPIGALADLIASTINQNVGGWRLSPMASEIERQTIQWIAEFLKYDPQCGGILVSGGNMANFIGFLTAKTIKGGENIQKKGLKGMPKQLLCYASKETHTWINKASDLFGLGSDAVRWIDTDENKEMKVNLLRDTIKKDIADGFQPFLVVGTAGSVSFGAIDPLQEIAKVCKEFDLWFHIDGAYGAPAAASSFAPEELGYLNLADSLAVDPHKWLYSALEVGCTLVKNPDHLRSTFSHHPAYYEFGTQVQEIDYHEYGLQNSRGFRALKVWLAFKLLGRNGFIKLIDKDIELSRLLFSKIADYQNIYAYSNFLSITTFRYMPEKFYGMEEEKREEINELNKEILQKIFKSGKAFVSNAYVDDVYLLRACLVNFRTREKDLDMLLEMVNDFGTKLSAGLSHNA